MSNTQSDQVGNQHPQPNLALTRTVLANERTLLAYGRTALMFAATGVTLLKLYGHEPLYFVLGWVSIVIAAGVAALGAGRFRKLAGTLRNAD